MKRVIPFIALCGIYQSYPTDKVIQYHDAEQGTLTMQSHNDDFLIAIQNNDHLVFNALITLIDENDASRYLLYTILSKNIYMIEQLIKRGAKIDSKIKIYLKKRPIFFNAVDLALFIGEQEIFDMLTRHNIK